jgi:hypothetical protein
MRIMRVIALVILFCGVAMPRTSTRDIRAARWTAEHSSIRRIFGDDSLRDRIEVAQAVSNVCYTPYFYCFLPGYAPVGTPCWCATPNGPVNGVVR